MYFPPLATKNNNYEAELSISVYHKSFIINVPQYTSTRVTQASCNYLKKNVCNAVNIDRANKILYLIFNLYYNYSKWNIVHCCSDISKAVVIIKYLPG